MCDPRELDYAEAYSNMPTTHPDYSTAIYNIHKTMARIMQKPNKQLELDFEQNRHMDRELQLELIRLIADNAMLIVKQDAYDGHYSSYTDLLDDITTIYLKMEDDLNNVDEGHEDFYSQHQNVVDEIFFQFKNINDTMHMFNGDLAELHEQGIPYIITLKNHS